MRSGSAWVVMGLGAAFVLGGCHLVLGLDEYSLVEGTGGPSCNDGQRNVDETDVDCGGGTCAACEDFKGCVVGADCVSSICAAGTCRPSACEDGVKNGDETGVDCGGSCAGLCKNDEGCTKSSECQSGVCRSTNCVDYHEWSKVFGGVINQTPVFAHDRIATDDQQNIVVASSFVGNVDFGGGMIASPMAMGVPSPHGVALAKLDATGAHLWSKGFGGIDSNVFATDVAVDSSGNIAMMGSLFGTVDFGGGTIGSPNSSGVFVARFDPSGKHLASKGFAMNGTGLYRMSIGADGAGNMLMASSFTGTTSLGGPLILATGGADAVVAKLGPSATHVWSKRIGGTSSQDLMAVTGVAVDKSGAVVVTGTFTGTVNLGGSDLISNDTEDDVFVVKFGTNGDHKWSKSFGGPGKQAISLPVVDSAGNIVVTGVFENWIAIDSAFLQTSNPYDIFLAELDANGNLLWGKSFGKGSSTGDLPFVGVDADQNVTLAGLFTDTIDLGGGALTGMMGENIFVARLDASGNHQWSKHAPYVPHTTEIAVPRVGEVLLTGVFDGTVGFSDSTIKSADAMSSFFLIKLRTP